MSHCHPSQLQTLAVVAVVFLSVAGTDIRVEGSRCHHQISCLGPLLLAIQISPSALDRSDEITEINWQRLIKATRLLTKATRLLKLRRTDIIDSRR